MINDSSLIKIIIINMNLFKLKTINIILIKKKSKIEP